MSSTLPRKTTHNKLLTHNKFIERIRKSLYFGNDSFDSDLEISRPLAEYSAELFSEAHRGHSLNRLHSVSAGSLHATPCSLIMALIYLDRLHSSDPGFLRRITPQELFIVSMMISTKVYVGYDEIIDLQDWAKQGHINKKRLKSLELDFLSAIDWTVHVSNEQFFKKLHVVEKSLAWREGAKRGWLTYTELIQFLPTLRLAKMLINHFTLLAVSYTAGIITLTSAMLLANQIKTLNETTLVKQTNEPGEASRLEMEMLQENQLLQIPDCVTYNAMMKNYSCPKLVDNLDIDATTALLYLLEVLQPILYDKDTHENRENNQTTYKWHKHEQFNKPHGDWVASQCLRNNLPMKSIS